jgi:hypothetical protein
MPRRMPLTSGALGPLAVACATTTMLTTVTAIAGGADEAARTPARPPVRVYTNADLERVHPFAAQTGGSLVPAAPADQDPAGERETASRGRGESYWRREAAAVRERLHALEEQAAGLRTRIAERELNKQELVYGGRRRSSSGSASIASLLSSLAAVERRMQRTQEDLEERARRDRALPGWLR